MVIFSNSLSERFRRGKVLHLDFSVFLAQSPSFSFFAMSAPPTVLPIAATTAEFRSPQGSEPQSPAMGPVKAAKPTLSQMLRDHTESMDRQRKTTGTSLNLRL